MLGAPRLPLAPGLGGCAAACPFALLPVIPRQARAKALEPCEPLMVMQSDADTFQLLRPGLERFGHRTSKGKLERYEPEHVSALQTTDRIPSRASPSGIRERSWAALLFAGSVRPPAIQSTLQDLLGRRDGEDHGHGPAALRGCRFAKEDLTAGRSFCPRDVWFLVLPVRSRLRRKIQVGSLSSFSTCRCRGGWTAGVGCERRMTPYDTSAVRERYI